MQRTSRRANSPDPATRRTVSALRQACACDRSLSYVTTTCHPNLSKPNVNPTCQNIKVEKEAWDRSGSGRSNRNIENTKKKRMRRLLNGCGCSSEGQEGGEGSLSISNITYRIWNIAYRTTLIRDPWKQNGKRAPEPRALNIMTCVKKSVTLCFK